MRNHPSHTAWETRLGFSPTSPDFVSRCRASMCWEMIGMYNDVQWVKVG